MTKKKYIFCIFYCLCFFSTAILADKTNPDFATWQAHPIYLGVIFGYGSTDWSPMVARYNNQFEYDLLSVSAPIAAGDKGIVWGGVVGYEVQPHFAFEFNYTRFPNTTVLFDQFSVYALSDNVTSMRSSTYAYDLIGKFMVPLWKTGFRAFASAGGALIHRHDVLSDTGHISPTFGIGLNYVFIQHVMFDVGFQYYAGYGKAVLWPAVDYIPFLYSITAKVAYRF